MKKIKQLLFILVAVATTVACVKTPEAGFTVDKTNPITGETLKFTNTTINGLTYAWEFGDGSTSADESPSHVYSTAGTYTVKLTAYSKKEKKSNEFTKIVTITKNTKEKITGFWNFNSIDYVVTYNGATVDQGSQDMSGSTINFKADGTYDMNFSGNQDSGTWSVYAEGVSLMIDSTLATINSLTETAASLSSSETDSQTGAVTNYTYHISK